MFYIGSLGSKKTHAARIKRLTQLGLTDSQINRIHGPVGLNIGSKSPAEIATAILAEIIESLRKDGTRGPQRVAAIVLAAGLSKRMGKTNKLLVDIGGKPMIRHVVDRISESNVEKIVVVLGHKQSDVRRTLEGTRASFVENMNYQEGLSSSIKAGLKALSANIDGAVICLGDMPLVSGRLLNTLMEEFSSRAGRAICVPTYEGRRGNPVLWPSELFGEILQIDGDVGARDLIDHYADLVIEVSQPDGALLFDIDTHDELNAFHKKQK